jgi:hypothetical protein
MNEIFTTIYSKTMNTTQFPRSSTPEMNAFYGAHILRADGTPTREWCEQYLTLIDTPYPMRLAWDVNSVVTKIRCHKKVADDLHAILAQIYASYGTLETVKTARMDLFGGCYNFRAVRGHSHLSVHAWGAAIDLDPERNSLGRVYDEKIGMMPQAVVEIFKAHGWEWGGLWKRGDSMHFQAARG